LELEGSGATVVRLDHHAADDVGRHQVGGELNARVAEMQDATECPEEGGFAQAGNAFEQDVPACHQADKDAVDDVLLPNDDLANLFPDPVQLGYGLIQANVVLHLFMVTPVTPGAHESARGGRDA
jgi:hypothetical protein